MPDYPVDCTAIQARWMQEVAIQEIVHHLQVRDVKHLA
jgi:hypothetical protein